MSFVVYAILLCSILGNKNRVLNYLQLFKKYILLNFAGGPFIALDCHKWKEMFPSMDHMDNIGNCRLHVQ